MLQEIGPIDFCKAIIKQEKQFSYEFLELGEALYTIREQKWYLPEWDSFAAFCKELPRSQGYISKLINIHKRLVLEYKISREELVVCRFANLSDVLPLCINKERTDFWVSRLYLSRPDLRALIKRKTWDK